MSDMEGLKSIVGSLSSIVQDLSSKVQSLNSTVESLNSTISSSSSSWSPSGKANESVRSITVSSEILKRPERQIVAVTLMKRRYVDTEGHTELIPGSQRKLAMKEKNSWTGEEFENGEDASPVFYATFYNYGIPYGGRVFYPGPITYSDGEEVPGTEGEDPEL